MPARALLAAGALLAAASGAMAQIPAGYEAPPATVQFFPIGGEDATGSMTILERDHHLVVDLSLTRLPANQAFALRFADEGRCYAGPDAAPGSHAFVVARPELRSDANGAASLHIVLDDLTLAPGPRSIARFSQGIYTDSEHGGHALACGSLNLHRIVTTTQMPGPPASLDDARACMDSEERIVAFDRRRDADYVAVDASRTADERLAASQVQAAHEAQLQAYLKTHQQVCGKLVIGARERATVLAERAAAASAAR